jgi:hypothetical protein
LFGVDKIELTREGEYKKRMIVSVVKWSDAMKVVNSLLNHFLIPEVMALMLSGAECP